MFFLFLLLIFSEQCGNDFEKAVDKILMNKWYNEPQNTDYQQVHQSHQPEYQTSHHSACDDQRSAQTPQFSPNSPQNSSSSSGSQYFPNYNNNNSNNNNNTNSNNNYGNQTNPRIIQNSVYNNQDYLINDDMVHRVSD